MHNPTTLLCFALAVSASPALRLHSRALHGSYSRLQRRGDLPSVSAVLAALQKQSILPGIGAEPTLASNTGIDLVPTSSTSLPVTTLPYTGPGILILPNSSSIPGHGSLPTTTPNAQARGTFQNAGNHSSDLMHHFAVVGGAIAAVVLLTACLFFLADPRIWKSCCISRQDKLRLARAQRAQRKSIPAWMRIDFGPSLSGKQVGEKEAPTVSPYPYPPSQGPKSKFSMTLSDYYDDSDISTSFATTDLSPPLSNGPSCPSPCIPSSSTFTGPGNPPSTPVRPPRPPTTDSPAGIESVYYADVDDQNFYRHPNPIVLEPTSPIINNPPLMARTGARSHPNPLASKDPGIDAPQRHARSRSAPTTDTPSTSRRNSDHTSIAGTLESLGSESVYSSVRHRNSTSAVSWIQYSEFQHQHHLQLQRQSAPSDRRASSPSPSLDRGGVGSAY